MWTPLLVACLSDPADRVAAPPPPDPRAAVRPASDEAAVQIEVAFPEREMQRIAVQTTWRCPSEGTAEWWMANWTPGSYTIRDHASGIETIAASSGRVVQVAKNRWQVRCTPGEPLTVATTLVASDRNVRENFVAQDWATLNPPAAFVLPEPPLGPFDVVVDLPEDWPDVVAPLPQVADHPHTFRALDLDTLIDSPFAMGELRTETLEVGGASHHFVTFGDNRTFDHDLLSTSVVDLIAAQQAFWGDVPYGEYWFLQALTGTYGGLEHYRSTLMMSDPTSTDSRKSTIRWLGLVSHEFFHTWNVQRLRPRALLAQDYEHEAHTELLWVAEGWTAYYDDLLLARAGLLTVEEYLDLLGKQIVKVESRPGRLVQSLASSSFNAWTKFYHPTPHQLNSTVGYYAKGAVVAFLLDAEIRRASSGRASLDDVARALRVRSEQPALAPLPERLQQMGERRTIRGVDPSDIREVASEIAGRDLTAFFDQAVDAPGELDYGGALQWFGLILERDDVKPGIGIKTEVRDGRVIVSGVFRDEPAWNAGLNVGDELVSIDDRRVDAGSLSTAIRECEGACRVLRSRDGELATLAITPKPRPGPPSLKVHEGASPLAARRRREWLGQ